MLLRRHAVVAVGDARPVAAQRAHHNFSYVDIGWSANFAVLALLYVALAPGYLPRKLLIAAHVRGSRPAPGAGTWRSASSASRKRVATCSCARSGAASGNLNLKFLAFFEFQAVLNVFLSLPLLLACFNRWRRLADTRVDRRRDLHRRPARRKPCGCAARRLQARSGQQGRGVRRRSVALLAPSELLLRMADLDRLCRVRQCLRALRLARGRDAAADASFPAQCHGCEGHRGAGAAQ